MQFWFNTSAINSTEDVIEAYFHIYKRRAPRPVTGQSNHRISVRVTFTRLTQSSNVPASARKAGVTTSLYPSSFFLLLPQFKKTFR